MPIIVPSGAARTLGDLKARIADELARADLSAQIALAVTDAIDEACTHRFWFMETRGLTIPLTPGVDTYSGDAIGQLIEVDRVRLVIGSQTYRVDPASSDDVDRWNDGTAPQGQPFLYARYGDTIRVYPTPTAAWTISIDGLTRGADMSEDTDSTIWTTTGEKYVRAIAKRNLLLHVIREPEEAAAMDAIALRYRREFEAQSHTRMATGTMAAYA